MRGATRYRLLLVALALALTPGSPRTIEAESTTDEWDAAVAEVQSLILARTKDVRDLRKKTDELVEDLNRLAKSNVVKLKPEVKYEIARKRLFYYTQLGKYNSAIVDIERTINQKKLPEHIALRAREKLDAMLNTFRNELKATVVALNHVARSIKDL